MHLDHWFPSVIGRSEHPEWIDPMNTLLDQIFNVADKNVNSNFYYNGETTYGTKSLVDDPAFTPFIDFAKQKAIDFLDMQGFETSRIPWRPYFFANSFLTSFLHSIHHAIQLTSASFGRTIA